MKNIKSFIGALLLAAFALTACTPDDYGHLDPNGIPSVEGVTPVITVDQDINQVTFTLPADLKGVMPIWIIDGKTYSTQNGLKKIYTKAGDYEVEMKLMNRNGISDGSVKSTFHIDNTVFDFDKYLTLFCGGTKDSSKEWRIDNSAPGHLGCGPSGTTGTEWWSADADNKAGTGLYDNRLVFGSDYSYTFNPGENGTMYVNYGTTALNTTGATEDFSMAVSEMKTNYSFDVVGEDLYLVLPEHTYFPYIANDDIWNTPRYKVESITGSTINLVSDNGSIAWHYILTSGAAAVTFNGFKYNSDFNIWKPIDDNSDYTTTFWYAPGWSQIADPGFAQNGSEYTFTLPSATTDQWQAQCFIVPNSLNLSASTHYDFSCIINSSTDISHVTLKLTDKSNDGNYVFTEVVAVKAYEDYIFYLSDINALTDDADCKLVLDFGGNGDDCTISVKNIVLKDHANDDGTVLPSDDPEPTTSVEWRETDNLLKNANMSEITYWYAPGWSQIADPATTVADGAYTLTFPEATTDTWMNQFTFNNTGVQLSADKTYDYRVTFNSSKPFNGVTVKLTQQDDDNVYITADKHEITDAYTDQTIELVGLTGQDISNLKIVYDFGGNEAGTEITVKNMLLQEHKKSADELTWDAEAADNMWTADMIPNWAYYAPGWSQIADPVITQNGRAFTISLPSATTDQWQAQVACKNTGISTSATNTYDFQALLTPNQDLNGVTVKLVLDGDDNTFYFADRVDLKAYETYTFRKAGMTGIDMDKVNLFFDFGGNPDGTEVEVKDIILRPASSSSKRHISRYIRR